MLYDFKHVKQLIQKARKQLVSGRDGSSSPKLIVLLQWWIPNMIKFCMILEVYETKGFVTSGLYLRILNGVS